MDRKEYADFLIKTTHDYNYYLDKYKKRELKEGAMVTRLAPSPTGMVHLGSLYSGFIDKVMASQSNGICYLRIEDTDTKRTVENGVNTIIDSLNKFGITFDEGVAIDGEKGEYGPYVQSKREDIYKAFAKKLIIEDKAYPCFCTKEDEEHNKEIQTKNKEQIGYYGRWAKCRKLTMEDVIEKVNNGDKYIIRLKSRGNPNHKIKFKDCIIGKMEIPQNNLDIPIIKSDGLPTYHFAHAVDDSLMGTTHVIRGEEWLPSLDKHIDLFESLGFRIPKYAHISTLMVDDNGTRRKISKRKDPWADVNYFHKQGIPNEALVLYMATLTNSNFEAWQNSNKDKSYKDFEFTFNKMSKGGTMYDYDKIINISKNFISTLKAEEVYKRALKYTREYDREMYELLVKYKDYSIGIFNIEREKRKPRKDIASFNDIKNQTWYMYDELFKPQKYEWGKITNSDMIKKIFSEYMDVYDSNDDQDEWFKKMKKVAESLGFAPEMKLYRENPDNYKGSIADFSTVLRVGLTSKSMTPDLYEIMKLFGREKMEKRIVKIFN
ncbi:MAG: glutamate--tRNA ligase [Bacilli bacterium]|nr:glutamate--tRNA ligase [Bacilli bacterium]